MSDADKPALRQAKDNPWYCLATVHGEQAAGEDREHHAKNRKAWNSWIAEALSDKERTELVKNGFPEPELAPLSPEEKSAFYSAFAARTGRDNELPPEPAHGADFSHTRFERDVVFAGFLFAHADFGSATFSGNADFGEATFSGRADFSSATFSGKADFSSATFSGNADFGEATFSGNADFGEATFSGFYALFREARFFSGAHFRSAKFSSYAHFGAAKFSSYADFGAATFSGNADFSATFSGKADFIDANCSARTIFAGASFENFVPDFRGATMHEATEWHRVRWPKPPQNEDAARAQVNAYERLKRQMEEFKKHEDEQQFFRRELRARRGLVRPWSGEWLLNVIYEASSDYGLSINRPLLWLFLLFVLGIFSILTETPALNSAPMTIPHAAKHSFANIFPFLPLKRETMAADMAAGLSYAAQIMAVAQSLLGPLLLFLLGLALRNRFRMK